MKSNIIDTPAYMENLIIYEVATKNFTSPNGPESGTFASLIERIPYLEELGINAIWLSGHQLCDDHHFYNIWTEYACIRPDKLDPSLGSEEDFRNMIDTAHKYGIKVFLDVITHGVMKNSSLVQEHPEWFKGESWGMMDYDWYGEHRDLDEWWINTWFSYVKEFDVDGFRLDVAHYRNDLWAKIRKKAMEIGREIAIIGENGPAIKGVVDFLQHGEVISHNYGLNRSSRILNDAISYYKDRQVRAGESYEIKIFYEDGTIQDSSQNIWYQNEKVPEIFWEGTETRVSNNTDLDVVFQVQLGKMKVKNTFGSKEIQNIQMKDKQGQLWNSNIDLDGIIEVDFRIDYEKKNNELLLEFPLRIQDGRLMSTQLSCHDNGWEGYPSDENPYAAQGSRYLMGYTTLLVPGVPVFMSGEEFNADYRPLPNLSPKLFGEGIKGGGRWLYGSWIDWNQLKDSEKNDMFQDVKKIIQIRHAHSELIKAYRMGEDTPIYGTIDYQSSLDIPVPYYYQSDDYLLLVAANPHTKEDVNISFHLQEVLSKGTWKASMLFGDLPINDHISGKASDLGNVNWTIKRDKMLQGGLLVVKFEKI